VKVTITSSPSFSQRLKAAPQERQLEPNPEPTAKVLSVASNLEARRGDQMNAIDSDFQASTRQQGEDIQSQPQPAEHAGHAPSCRTILPKRQRSERLRDSSGLAKQPRRSARTSRQASLVVDPRTLIEQLDAFGSGMRTRQLAALLGIGRSTLYEWVGAGTIPAYKHRGVVFFDPAMIAIWLRKQAVTN
jgi:excisionase family DNA binding protein